MKNEVMRGRHHLQVGSGGPDWDRRLPEAVRCDENRPPRLLMCEHGSKYVRLSTGLDERRSSPPEVSN